MGWLFAVALGLQNRRRTAVLAALVPIAVGHAASVALVFSIGALMMHTANQSSRPSAIARANPNPAKPAVALAAADTDLETLPVGSVEDLDSRVGYLQGTDDVTSFDQVRREMATLVASLDM